jgi:LysM repeat protein
MNVYHAGPPELTTKELNLLESIIKAIKDAIKFVMDILHAAVDVIDKVNGYINDVLAIINEVNNLINTLGNVLKYASSTILGAIDSIGNAITGFVDSLTNVVDGVHTVVALKREVGAKIGNIGDEINNANERLVKAWDSLVDEWNALCGTGNDSGDSSQEGSNSFNMTITELKDTISVMLDDAGNIVNELATAAKSEAIPDITIGSPDPDTGAQRFVLAYGHSTVTLKSTDSLESLAAQYYGSSDNAIDVATYNGVASIDELEPGDKIKIPVLKKTQRNSNNRIYARREDRDNYGRDIALDSDGYVLASPSGDYKLAGGTDNLSQAVLLRLRESVDKRIRKNAYGIRTNISDPTAGTAYVLSSIDLTVRGEPRVKSIENIRFSGRGDNLTVTVDYTDINSAGGTASGRA